MLVITRASIIVVEENINGESLTIIDGIIAIIFIINIDDARVYYCATSSFDSIAQKNIPILK